MTKIYFFFMSWGLSCLLVALAQKAWFPVLCIPASFAGWSLFFFSIEKVSSRRKQFFLASFWFFCVQLFQLSWMTSQEYQPKIMYVVFLSLALICSIQWGLCSFLFPNRSTGGIFRSVWCLPALWTLMEYSRLWIFSGFTWNPVGLTLASASIYPLQYVSWIGVYGLSFLVIQWNSLLYCVLRKPLDKTKKMLAISYILLFLGLAWAIYEYRDKQFNQVDKSLKVLLVQTAISPGEKIGYGQGKALHPFDQWERIFSLIAPYKHHKIDLVLLPEYALPGSAFDPLYDYESIKSLFKTHLSSVYESSYLPLQVPLAYFDSESNSWRVSNAYIATLLAKCLKTEIVMGMDYRERLQNKVFSYNAAFFVSHEGYYNVYAKHILVPMGEYIPFDCFKSWAKNYGIEDSFAKGSLSPLMGKNNLGISICYEETFGNFMRIKIKKGAKVLVNLSNLAWFANSKLNEQQAEHARIRSVENGVPLMRISNTGVTNIVDSLGREKVRLGTDFPKDEWQRKALYASVPMYSYKTFYTQHGDKPLIIFSLGIIVIFIIIKKNKSS